MVPRFATLIPLLNLSTSHRTATQGSYCISKGGKSQVFKTTRQILLIAGVIPAKQNQNLTVQCRKSQEVLKYN